MGGLLRSRQIDFVFRVAIGVDGFGQEYARQGPNLVEQGFLGVQELRFDRDDHTAALRFLLMDLDALQGGELFDAWSKGVGTEADEDPGVEDDAPLDLAGPNGHRTGACDQLEKPVEDVLAAGAG